MLFLQTHPLFEGLHTHAVRLVDALGNVNAGATVEVETMIATSPEVPRDLAVTGFSGGRATLAWTPPAQFS